MEYGRPAYKKGACALYVYVQVCLYNGLAGGGGASACVRVDLPPGLMSFQTCVSGEPNAIPIPHSPRHDRGSGAERERGEGGREKGEREEG